MSADDCICILKTTDNFKHVFLDKEFNGESIPVLENTFGKGIIAYRVAHIQASDNFEWLIKNELHNLGDWMRSLFGNSPIFYDESDATKYALKIENGLAYPPEYDITILDGLKYNFPGC